jgi:hypothetical protein
MAGKASSCAHNRRMSDPYVLSLIFMTIKTETVNFFEDKFRVLGGVDIVTGYTLSLFKGTMLHISPSFQF